jgi:hypothetical protein
MYAQKANRVNTLLAFPKLRRGNGKQRAKWKMRMQISGIRAAGDQHDEFALEGATL